MASAIAKSAKKTKMLASRVIPDSSWNIFRGDRVMVTSGRDRGESGVVSRVDRARALVYVSGLNTVKKHVKGQKDQPGTIATIEQGLHRSKVSLVDPVNGCAVRSARMFTDDGTRVRVSRGRLASGSVIPMPVEAMSRRSVKATGVGPADTPLKVVLKVTKDASGDLFAGIVKESNENAGE